MVISRCFKKKGREGRAGRMMEGRRWGWDRRTETKDGGEESQGVSRSFVVVLKCFMEKDRHISSNTAVVNHSHLTLLESNLTW